MSSKQVSFASSNSLHSSTSSISSSVTSKPHTDDHNSSHKHVKTSARFGSESNLDTWLRRQFRKCNSADPTLENFREILEQVEKEVKDEAIHGGKIESSRRDGLLKVITRAFAEYSRQLDWKAIEAKELSRRRDLRETRAPSIPNFGPMRTKAEEDEFEYSSMDPSTYLETSAESTHADWDAKSLKDEEGSELTGGMRSRISGLLIADAEMQEDGRECKKKTESWMMQEELDEGESTEKENEGVAKGLLPKVPLFNEDIPSRETTPVPIASTSKSVYREKVATTETSTTSTDSDSDNDEETSVASTSVPRKLPPSTAPQRKAWITKGFDVEDEAAAKKKKKKLPVRKKKDVPKGPGNIGRLSSSDDDDDTEQSRGARTFKTNKSIKAQLAQSQGYPATLVTGITFPSAPPRSKGTTPASRSTLQSKRKHREVEREHERPGDKSRGIGRSDEPRGKKQKTEKNQRAEMVAEWYRRSTKNWQQAKKEDTRENDLDFRFSFLVTSLALLHQHNLRQNDQYIPPADFVDENGSANLLDERPGGGIGDRERPTYRGERNRILNDLRKSTSWTPNYVPPSRRTFSADLDELEKWLDMGGEEVERLMREVWKVLWLPTGVELSQAQQEEAFEFLRSLYDANWVWWAQLVEQVKIVKLNYSISTPEVLAELRVLYRCNGFERMDNPHGREKQHANKLMKEIERRLGKGEQETKWRQLFGRDGRQDAAPVS